MQVDLLNELERGTRERVRGEDPKVLSRIEHKLSGEELSTEDKRAIYAREEGSQD